MSTWVAPYMKPGRIPQTEGYYAICSNCSGLGFFSTLDGAQVVADGHVCKTAKVERTRCDCPWDEVSRGGCRRHS